MGGSVCRKIVEGSGIVFRVQGVGGEGRRKGLRSDYLFQGTSCAIKQRLQLHPKADSCWPSLKLSKGFTKGGECRGTSLAKKCLP